MNIQKNKLNIYINVQFGSDFYKEFFEIKDYSKCLDITLQNFK